MQAESTLHYWESRRISYNLLLVLNFIFWIAWTWPRFRPGMTLQSFGIVAVLAVLANLCYSAVYLGDAAARAVLAGKALVRSRQFLWIAGTIVAIIFETYWIQDEILSSLPRVGS
jgi:hypothetical protein